MPIVGSNVLLVALRTLCPIPGTTVPGMDQTRLNKAPGARVLGN